MHILADTPRLKRLDTTFTTKVMRMACGDMPNTQGSVGVLMSFDPDAGVIACVWDGVDTVARLAVVLPQLHRCSRVAAILIEVVTLYCIGEFGGVPSPTLHERRQLVLEWHQRTDENIQRACLLRYAKQLELVESALRAAVGYALQQTATFIPKRCAWSWLSEYFRKKPMTYPGTAKYPSVFWRRYLRTPMGSCDWQFDCDVMKRVITHQLAYDCYTCATYCYRMGHITVATRLLNCLVLNFPSQAARISQIVHHYRTLPQLFLTGLYPSDCWDPPRDDTEGLPGSYFDGFGTVAVCPKRVVLQHVIQGGVLTREGVHSRKGADYRCSPGRPSFMVYNYLDVGIYHEIAIDVNTGEWSCARKKGKTADTCSSSKLLTFSGLGKWIYFKNQCYFICRCGMLTLWRIASCRYTSKGVVCIFCRQLPMFNS